MNHPQTLIAALAGAPEIIIGLVREVPLQRLKCCPSPNKGFTHEHTCHITSIDAPDLATFASALPHMVKRRGMDWCFGLVSIQLV